MKGLLTAISLVMALAWNTAQAEEPATGPVNLNTATVEELSELKGIGKAKAEAIIAHRKEHGEFRKVEELTEVKGIGDSILDSNRPLLSLE
ncbi:MAG: helix-hairpin-helix domain-containing protein [Pseudomonadota bacterium]|jgi:competence protein ComEA|nr:helix-hairpin-helix domain-containing protein [Pseudomonadota bacterium]